MAQPPPRPARGPVRRRPPTILQANNSAVQRQATDSRESEERESRAKLLERRANILQELFKTEATYVEYLQVAITIFLQPIETGSGSIRKDQAAEIFQNIEELQRINSDLLKQMAIRKAATKNAFHADDVWIDLLRDAFKKPELKEAYQKYMHGYNHAMSVMDKLTKRGNKNTAFGNWLQGQLLKNADLCRGLANLPAFLICPVQRLPRYLLILRDLQKCTPEDHPDYPNLEEALALIKEIVGSINEGKVRYDEMYYLQGLYERFSVYDRQNVPELIDTESVLVTEGPILLYDPETGSSKLRYLILLTHMLICVKERKHSFVFNWKVDLYKCIIRYDESGDGDDDSPIITISEQKKHASEEQLTSEVMHIMYTFSDASFDFTYWKNHLFDTQTKLLNLDHIAACAMTAKTQLQEQLLSRRDWDLLAVGAASRSFEQGAVIVEDDNEINHLYYITHGRCSIELKGFTTAVLREGDAFGESVYLKVNDPEVSTSLVADSEKVTVVLISFDRLTSILSGNADLARRFFRVVTLVASTYYLNRASRAVTAEENGRVRDRSTGSVDIGDGGLASGEQSPSVEAARKTNKKVNPALVKLKLDEVAPDEEVLQEYPCKLKKTKFFGQLYVLREHIGFYSNVLGKKTRLVAHSSKVTEVVARDDLCIYINHLTRDVGAFELQFKTKEHKEEAYTILASLLSDQQRSLAAKTGLKFTASGARRGSVYALENNNWESLCAKSTEFTVMEDDIVLPQGFMDDHFYQVIEGQCTVKTVDASGEERQLDLIGTGEVFGEIPFLLGLATNATVEAQSGTVIASLMRQDIEPLLLSQPEFAAAFYKFLAKTLFCRLVKLYKSSALEECKAMSAPIPGNKVNVRTPFPKSPIALRRKQKNTASMDLGATHKPLRPTPGVLATTHSSPNPMQAPRPVPPARAADASAVEGAEDPGVADGWLTAKKRSPNVSRRPMMTRETSHRVYLSPLRQASDTPAPPS